MGVNFEKPDDCQPAKVALLDILRTSGKPANTRMHGGVYLNLAGLLADVPHSAGSIVWHRRNGNGCAVQHLEYHPIRWNHLIG